MTEEDKAQVKETTDAILDWLEANPEATVEDIEAKRQDLESKLNPIIVKLRDSAGAGGDDDGEGESKFY